LDRRVPIILLIEHDDIDRMTLFRMLADRGYRIMAASRGVDALDTFVCHHSEIALVLSNAWLPDIRNAQLVDALHRIDARVPVIAARHPDHQPTSRDVATRSLAFAGLVAEVDRRVFHTSGERNWSGEGHGVLSWPLRDEEVDEIEGAEDDATYVAALDAAAFDSSHRPSARSGHGEFVDGELLENVTRPSGGLKPITTRDPRNYLASLSSARRTRRRRIGRLGVLVGMLVAVAVTAVTQLRPTRARATAIEQDAAMTARYSSSPAYSSGSVYASGPVTPSRPTIFSSPVTGLFGTVHLVSSERTQSTSPGPTSPRPTSPSVQQKSAAGRPSSTGS
jgi:CheY-like chemotaxis protein